MNRSVPTVGGKPEVVEDRRQGAVDVERDRLDRVPRAPLRARAANADAVARRAAVLGQVEQHRDPRIDRRVHAMAETGQPPLRRRSPRRPADAPRSSSDSDRVRAPIEPGRDQLHAGFAGAAVLVADGEHAGGDGRGQRLAIARRREPRRRARRRAGAVVRRRRSGCASSSRRSRGGRQPFVMQQEDQVGERRLAASGRGRRVRESRCASGPASTMAVRQGSIE